MGVPNIEKDFPDDLKEVILYKKGSCSFYKKALKKVEDFECIPIMQDVIKDETGQISKLEEELFSYAVGKETNYDPVKHGGIAVSMEKNINMMITLSIAIEGKRDSIQMYEALIEKQNEKDTEDDMLNDLLVSEREYLQKLEQSYKNANDNGSRTMDETIYRFTKKDVEIVLQSLIRERLAYRFFTLASKGIVGTDIVSAFAHTSSDEKKHVEIFEMIYRKLTGKDYPDDNSQLSAVETSVQFTDVFKVLDMAIKDDKNSISMYLNFLDECTNSWLRDVMVEIVEDEREHLSMWRRTYRKLKDEKGQVT
ncbi:MAG: ferritin family protein [Candidatus Anammoxibacter sp.]